MCAAWWDCSCVTASSLLAKSLLAVCVCMNMKIFICVCVSFLYIYISLLIIVYHVFLFFFFFSPAFSPSLLTLPPPFLSLTFFSLLLSHLQSRPHTHTPHPTSCLFHFPGSQRQWGRRGSDLSSVPYTSRRP